MENAPDQPADGTAPSETPPVALDAHGFDPAEYRWVPVKRQSRPDGWSDARQRLFIEALADTGSVLEAAMLVNMTAKSAYALRRAPDGQGFAAAWDMAIRQAALKLADVAFERAMIGSDEPVFDRNGERVGRRFRVSDRLLMFLLRAHLPERYRFANSEMRAPGEPPPPSPEPAALDEALRRLEPAPPAEPHLLMPPAELADALTVANLLDGKLPHWLRHDVDSAPAESLGPVFEAALEAAKRGEIHPSVAAWEKAEKAKQRE